ncbi:DUF58 domain-containing protein [Spirulina sp. CS-785/01]|uniref:DUF58 domain-containing protein n=1 Tax=Spirulina sp. CS-785/01 TaxID=3021716 RepID=UPI00232EA115|nr:DUF58 domain-containing protein [Spirulina sp. CS-785/01]MDB9315524.1 DUF58 domain-containing protein [Spirulina sp. CS-785/01]
MQTWIKKINNWLETHWATPSYGGMVLLVLALAFFGAATNTMAGWLYALSGLILALLGVAAVLAMGSLSQLRVRRRTIPPVSVGDELPLELTVENPTPRSKTLLQLYEDSPSVLGQFPPQSIELIPPHSSHTLTYYHPAKKRGVYYWDKVQLRTANPFGLFWCRRSRPLPAKAIVYPQVLPLRSCPLVDTIGREESLQAESDRRYQTATEGVTKTLRPYRFGDPTRLIHWRTSAKFGDLQVRELEVMTSGREVVICLDSGESWESRCFERAVTSAASLYFYASRAQLNIKLWTAKTGLVHGNRVVLETLAATYLEEDQKYSPPTDVPLIWLSSTPSQLQNLPLGSLYLLFPDEQTSLNVRDTRIPGLVINSQDALEKQLQLTINN